MKTVFKSGAFLLLLAVIVGFILYQLMNYRTDRGYLSKRTEIEMQQFLSAMESYQSLYGDYPAGKPSGILTALRGSNPQKIIFLNVDTRTNSSGELVDPWETPYQVVFDSTNHFTIQSAGKNKRFGDEDDFKLSSSEQR